jgi:uncharacterized protein (TIGR02246 family)
MLTWTWLGVVPGVGAQAIHKTTKGVTTTPAETQPAGSTSPGTVRTTPVLMKRPDDEKAIQSLAAEYNRAYNAGDARSLASLFTEDAEVIDENRERLRGRPMIEEVFGSMFRERPGATIAISPDSIRFLAPDVAQEEGRTQVKVPGSETPLIRHYTVLLVRQANRWMYSSLREEHEAGLSHHERLRELEWLVGEWLDESPDSIVHATCRWTDDQNFLLRDFTIRVQGKSVMTVNERIGWDPSTLQIKSWVFDSEGGYGSGLWSRSGNEWIIKSNGILPDGRTATATHVLTRISSQAARWASVERTVGNQVVPDHAQYVMVRRPPQPQSK